MALTRFWRRLRSQSRRSLQLRLRQSVQNLKMPCLSEAPVQQKPLFRQHQKSQLRLRSM